MGAKTAGAGMELRRVAVIGAGVMGTGVAQVLASVVPRVVLIDTSEPALQRALVGIRDGLRLSRLMGRERPDLGAVRLLGRVTASTDFALLRNVDFVIENVPERWTVKEQVYRALDRICPARCLFAANTSCTPITRIAAVTTRPDRVVGMHFMNPVPQKPVVEVIRGARTSDETVLAALGLLAAMGKKGIVVSDRPGFVCNRVLMLMINEAILTVQEGAASTEAVDHLFRTCLGHEMGPLETADLIGLDTVLDSIDMLHDSLNDPKFRAASLLRQMVTKGLRGRKDGRGFYSYDGGEDPGSIVYGGS